MVAISVIITNKVITEGRLPDRHVCRAPQTVSPAAPGKERRDEIPEPQVTSEREC